MNTRKGNRSRLADVLADIKKHGDENDVAPTPPKKRSTAANNTELKTNSTSATGSKTPTYILKLFDRPIQFSSDESRENTPLYPLCRAWVHGQPLKKQTKLEEPTPAAQPENVGESSDVYKLPPPKPKAEIMKRFNIDSADGDIDIRIPHSVRNFKRPDTIEETIDQSIGTMNHADCLAVNRERWRKVKGDWTQARQIHESRYEESFKILHEMYLSSCREK